MSGAEDMDRRVHGKKISSISAFFNRFIPFALTFVLMFGLWLVLSGKFEPLFLFFGVLSSFLVAFFFHDLLFSSFNLTYVPTCLKFLKYTPWLLLQIIKANFHLLYLVFHPRMKELIDPQIIRFDTTLRKDIAITTMANSITLTPGTITVTADSDGVFKVYAIDRKSARALPGVMFEKVADVFGETR